MKNGNLHDYAPHLPQKSRFPLISDVVNGLQYLHGLGVVHDSLKAQDVLISDEGRGLIVDFGSSYIITATDASSSLSSTTVRFAAPEMVFLFLYLPNDAQTLTFAPVQVLSSKTPYHQYKLDVQIIAALTRKEPPTWLGTVMEREEKDGWDDDFDQDWDTIDDQAWSLIMKRCSPEPEDRFDVSRVRELIVDLKILDDRPAPKPIPDAKILKLVSEPEIDLNRVDELLN
ncbi:Cytokinesis protein sepH [Leucoagaricus sp. SymC.cos]|nr:Cytokinesis protein sepH [Leucoagaricus sp. SymC.cos]